ncbi:MAG TPA: DNA cytosine methyltransferase [Phaeodactylibacter sp.]|nr:DNA cytosine methyltransferase [Phaeodactylibacter sp.]
MRKQNNIPPLSVWEKTVKVEENSAYWQGVPQVKKMDVLPNKKPIVVELFCGCGGTSLGFEMAGFKIALGCDIHQPSIETFQYNHPHTSTILGNIKKISPSLVQRILGNQPVDVLIAGVPCQGFSLNNRKRHQGDDRNMMYKEFIRFVKKIKPKCIVMENVSGMKSVGNFVSDIEKELSEAGGMEVKSQLLFAPDYGVPQKRKRLFFIGIKNKIFDFSKIKKTHGESTGKPYVTIREAIGDLPSLQSNESKNTYDQPPFSEYQKWARAKSNNILINHQAPNHPLATIEKIKNTRTGTPMYPRFKQRIRLAWEDLSPTQVSGGIRPQFQLGHPSDCRGLTIRERCRIQSFPDNFEVKGGIVQARVQTGNAVPPLLAKAIAAALSASLHSA